MVVLLIEGASVAPVLLVLALVAFGIGLGVAVPNFMTAALESVPETQVGSAAGVLSMSRYVASPSDRAGRQASASAAGVLSMSRYGGSITTSPAVTAFVTTDAGGSRVLFAMAVASMSLAVLVAMRLPNRAAVG